MRGPKNIFLNVLVFLAVFAVVVELCARIDDKVKYDAPFFAKYNYRILLGNDEDGIRHNIPNARFEKWKINSLGFRGAEVGRDKKEGYSRVVCFGASETFGLYESEGGEWPSRLGNLIGSRFPNWEVINGSIVGIGVKARKEYFQKYLMPLKPDVLILYLAGLEAYITRPGESGSVPLRDTAKPAVSKPKGVGFDDLLDNIRVFPKLKQVIKKCLPASLVKRISIWISRMEIRKKEAVLLKGQSPLDSVPQYAVAAFEEDLKGFVRQLQDKDIVPILSTYPTLVTEANRAEYENILLDNRRFSVQLSEKGMFESARSLNDAIKRIALELNLPLVDNDAAVPKKTEFFGDQVHYTDKGAAIIANNFYSFMNHSGILEQVGTRSGSK